MRKNRCLLSFADIVSQFLTPRVWKKAHQAWQAKHSASRWKLQAMVWVLLAMAWGLGDSVEERFVTARAAYVAHHLKARRPGETLAGVFACRGQSAHAGLADALPLRVGTVLRNVPGRGADRRLGSFCLRRHTLGLPTQRRVATAVGPGGAGKLAAYGVPDGPGVVAFGSALGLALRQR